jgi:hypothetical protein
MGMSSIRPLPFTISYAKKEEIHNLQNITSPPPVISKTEYKAVS